MKNVKCSLLAGLVSLAAVCVPHFAGAQEINAVDASVRWAFDKASENATTAEVSEPAAVSATSFDLGSNLYFNGTQGCSNETLGSATLSKLNPRVAIGRAEEKDAYVVFSVIPKKGIAFTPKKLKFNACKCGTSGGTLNIYAVTGDKRVEVAKAFDIDTLVVLGGDGSYMGAKQLDSLGVPTIGLPGTIDNDLGYTDYTIGFDTAVNGVIGEMDKIRDTMSSHERIGVIEVMGNHCGDIALDAAITGGAEYAIVPEEPFDIDEIGASLKRRRIQGQKTCLIVIAEGAGKGEAIANYLGAKTGFDVKSIKLGYVQRGGHPTVFDRMLASRMSLHAIKLISEGVSSRAVGIKDNKIIDMDLAEAVAVKNVFDKELYEFHKSLW